MTTTAFSVLTFLASGLSILVVEPVMLLDVSYILVHSGIVGVVIHMVDVLAAPNS